MPPFLYRHAVTGLDCHFRRAKMYGSRMCPVAVPEISCSLFAHEISTVVLRAANQNFYACQWQAYI